MNKNKRFYIAVDLEGVACTIGTPGQGLAQGSAGLEYAALQGTREANAAAKALFDNGADEVWVWDCHGTGYNLKYDLLDKRCKIVMGAGSGKRFPGIEEGFAGVLFIGYHAYDTIDAVLCHVYSSATFQHQKINGEFVGEAQIDGAVAGKYGVPVIFASSDDICISQMNASFPWAETVITKRSLAWNSCVSDHPETVCANIYAGVKKAAYNLDKMLPFTYEQNFEYEIRYKRIEPAQGCHYRNPDGTLFSRPDAYTRVGVLKDIEDIFR